MKAEKAKWARVIKSANIRADRQKEKLYREVTKKAR